MTQGRTAAFAGMTENGVFGLFTSPSLLEHGKKVVLDNTFEAFHLHPTVAAGVEAAGFTEPTPIQAQAIPPVMKGLDVMGLAQTGTGKTAAYVLPILNRLTGKRRGCVRALIMAPTRELAEQIHQDISTLGRRTGLRSVAVYGGVGLKPQEQKLRGRAEIVVACPGRLLDHIDRGNADFSSLEVLVLDEADQMFDIRRPTSIASEGPAAPRGRVKPSP